MGVIKTMYRGMVSYGTTPTHGPFRVGNKLKNVHSGNIIFSIELRGDKHPIASAGFALEVDKKTFKFGLQRYDLVSKPGTRLFAYSPDYLILELKKITDVVNEGELRQAMVKSFYTERKIATKKKKSRAVRKKPRAARKKVQWTED